MAHCFQCGKELLQNDIGANKKFINRGSTVFMCRACLAKELHISEERINEKIEIFKLQGCTLFV